MVVFDLIGYQSNLYVSLCELFNNETTNLAEWMTG